MNCLQLFIQFKGVIMCKNCFEYSEQSNELMDKNAELLAENIKLRQLLIDAVRDIQAGIKRSRELCKVLAQQYSKNN